MSAPFPRSPTHVRNVAEPLWSPVFACFSGPDTRNLNDLVLISFRLARTRVGASEGKLRRPALPAARHSQSQASRARSRRPGRAGASGSDRPQAASVVALRQATIGATCLHPPGEERTPAR